MLLSTYCVYSEFRECASAAIYYTLNIDICVLNNILFPLISLLLTTTAFHKVLLNVISVEICKMYIFKRVTHTALNC